ncbi:MAG: tetratricopeptide repeat protein [bacterium]|jgi:tetratricopeptide (TPR) repeat protein
MEGGDWRSYFQAGLQAVEQKRWTNAASLFKKANELKPDDHEVMIRLAYALRQIREFQQALELYRKLGAMLPQNAGVHFAWGTTLAELGQYEGAILLGEKALELGFSEKHRCHRLLGRMNFAIGNFEKARFHLQKYIDSGHELEQGDFAQAMAQIELIGKKTG